jgi:hypothetical protein
MAFAPTDVIVLYRANEQWIKIEGLETATIEDGGVVVKAFADSTASVSGTIYDSDGNVVPGGENIAFNYVMSSCGDFIGEIGPDFDPVEDANYSLVIDASQGPNVMQLVRPVQVLNRRE